MLYYPPKAGEHQLYPLIVISHGGPTTHTTMAFHSNILFGTHHYGVLDVNYRGSTGYKSVSKSIKTSVGCC